MYLSGDKTGLSLKEECELRMKAGESEGRRSSSLNTRRDQVRHYVISSSSSSTSRSRSSSGSNRSRSRSRLSKHRHHRRHKHSRKRYSGSKRRSGSRSRSHSYGRSHEPSSYEPASSAHSYEKKTYNYGTNSNDPKMVASRLFVGCLPFDITKDDIRAIFGKYGKIIGLTLLKGFGFIQYESEDVAQAAVNGERGSTLKGFTMDVKVASEGKPNKKIDEGHAPWQPPPGYQPPPPRPPLPGMPPPFGPPMPIVRGPLPPPDQFRRHTMMDPFAREPLPDFPPFAPPRPHQPPPPGPPMAVPGPPAPSVDCRILVLGTSQRMYAEGVQKRLMAAGIVTELNTVVDSEVVLAIEDATRRRMLFAIVVTEQNEIHRSITVNILHGMAQEHRNMPVDDAITLITRSFDKYMLDRRERTDGLGAGASRAAGLPPNEGQNFLQPSSRIQNLLNLLAEKRYLTASDLSLVIDYLVERRCQMDPSGGISARDAPSDEDARRPMIPAGGRMMDVDERRPPVSQSEVKQPTSVMPQREELPTSASSTKPSVSMINSSINLNNPNIKQALDNLISSGPNIFKNISETLAQKSSAAKYPNPDNHH